MWWIIGGLVWLVGGYFFAQAFVNYFLIDGRWSEGGKANPLYIHLAFPLMGPVMIIVSVAYFISSLNSLPNTDMIRRFYRIKER